MNTAQLSGWFQANKTPVLAVAGAGAVGLGLLQARKKSATAGGEPAPGGALAPFGGGGTAFAAGPAFAGTVPYDSGSYDSYNDLQNQIATLYDRQEQAKAPIPMPDNNQEWLNRATEGWVGTGQSALDIQAALGQYTRGEAINQHQSHGINWAIKNFGAPPEGTAGTSRVVPA